MPSWSCAAMQRLATGCRVALAGPLVEAALCSVSTRAFTATAYTRDTDTTSSNAVESAHQLQAEQSVLATNSSSGGCGLGVSSSSRSAVGATPPDATTTTSSSSSSSGSNSSEAGGLVRATLPPTPSAGRPVVAVAMSGGVDSSVAAWLLQRQGYEVFGIFMHTWDAGDEAGAGSPVCTAERDLADAQSVADQLRIPLLQLDVVQSYWTQVFEGFLAGLEAGLTPNPDLACNSAIKFGVLLEYAQQQGAEVLATGHYARTRGGWLQQQQWVHEAAAQQQETTSVQLLRGVDGDKDQTYFLASLGQQHLAAAAFPVGHLHKQQVRAIAAQAGLAPSSKRSSAGICFVGRRDFGAFLESYLTPRPGVFRDVDTQAALGPCPNMIPWTLGQRARLPGRPAAYFVAGKQLQEGVVWVAQGHEHPALYSRQVLLGPPSWVAGSAPSPLQQQHEGYSLACQAKARYRQQAVACSVGMLPAQTMGDAVFRASRFHQAPSLQHPGPAAGECLQADFVDAQRGLTPGQAFVIYDGDVCLGSAMVLAPGVTEWEKVYHQIAQDGHPLLPAHQLQAR